MYKWDRIMNRWTDTSFNFMMQRPFSLVKVRISGQGDHCINSPESARLATLLATLTPKSKSSFKSTKIK